MLIFQGVIFIFNLNHLKQQQKPETTFQLPSRASQVQRWHSPIEWGWSRLYNKNPRFSYINLIRNHLVKPPGKTSLPRFPIIFPLRSRWGRPKRWSRPQRQTWKKWQGCFVPWVCWARWREKLRLWISHMWEVNSWGPWLFALGDYATPLI